MHLTALISSVPKWSRLIGTGGRDPSEWVVTIAGMRKEESGSDKYPAEGLQTEGEFALTTRQFTNSFLRLAKLDGDIFERLNRYEARLWRQAVQILFVLHPIKLQ